MTQRHPPDLLRAFGTRILESIGAPSDTAGRVAASLVEADMRGYHTHGVALLPLYEQMIEAGAIDPGATPTVERHGGCTLGVDGRGGFGQLAARDAAVNGVAQATESGVAVVGYRDASHIGPVGEWARAATREGQILLGFTNTGGGAKNTAPYGGHERKLSTNPVAFGFPTFGALPFDIVADFATSQVSGSVVRERHAAGEPLHDEWTTTASGDPVTDPAAFMAGEGALLPLGGRATGHKGYALALAAELLGGFVGDSPVVGESDPEWLSNGGAFVLVDPTRFVDEARLRRRVAAVADHLRSDAVRLPGEAAHERYRRAADSGIAVTARRAASLADLAARLGLSVPDWLDVSPDDATAGDDDVQSW